MKTYKVTFTPLEPYFFGNEKGFAYPPAKAEAGESIEQAVSREIFEETSLSVCNLRYVSSQSWPFPNSLMLGFTAEYLSGELKVDGTELECADWYTPDNLPQLPEKGSIARMIIDDFCSEKRFFG